MKKRFFSLLLIISFILILPSCHKAKKLEEFVAPTEFDEQKQYEITFWAKNDTNLTQKEIYEKAISDFEALYPNIKVNFRLFNDYSKIYNDVITNISTGTTPNVCITYPDHIATYLSGSNTVVCLDELMDDEYYGLGGSELKFDSPSKEEIIPEFLGECVVGTGHYALPFMRSTEACYVNKTYVEALGFELPDVLTWDFIRKVSKKAMEKNDDGTFVINGQKTMIPFVYKSSDNMMIQMLKQKNIDYSDKNGNIYLFNDDTMALLYDVAGDAKTRAFSTFTVSGYPANLLNAGQCIFAVDSTAGATWMGSDAPLVDIAEDKILDFETAVLPVPQFDKDNIKMISQGPSVCVFNKPDSGEVLASWIFAQFLLTNDVQISYSQTEGYLPVTTKAQNSAKYKEYLAKCGSDNDLHYDVKIKAAKLLMDNTDKTFVTPVFNGSASLRTASGQLIDETVKAARRNKKIDNSFFEKLYSDIISLNRLDISEKQVVSDSGNEMSESDDNEKSGKYDKGMLPLPSIVLLCSLCAIWIAIIIYVFFLAVKKKNANKY